MKPLKTAAALLLLLGTVYAMCVCACAAERVYVAPNEYYDPDGGYFIHIVPRLNDREVYSTVANGMVTAGPVSVYLDDTSDVELYRDGEQVKDPDLSRISEAGGYTLSIIGVGRDYQPLSFLIVPEVTGALREYPLPTGFAVTEVTRNGREIASPVGCVDLTEEGSYSIGYVCAASGERYTLELTVDHTPPTLALAGVREDGVARGPVSIADAEEGASVLVLHNGRRKSVDAEGVLKDSGDYYIALTDRAGNTSEYVFRIGVYFNLVTTLAFLLLALILAAAGFYLSRQRKKMRVR